MACLLLNRGDREAVGLIAQKARKGLSGMWESFFPDGIRALLEDKQPPMANNNSSEEFLERFFKMTEELSPPTNITAVLMRLVSVMNRFLGAERGGLFWCEKGKNQKLVLRTAQNLSTGEVASTSFRSNMILIKKSFRENIPVVIRSEKPKQKLAGHGVFAILCIPLKLADRVSGVLYHDNSYLDDCFAFLNNTLLKQLAGHLSNYMDRIMVMDRIMQNSKASNLKASNQMADENNREIITQSSVMEKILVQSDRIACSDSTVLIQGGDRCWQRAFSTTAPPDE